MKRVFDFVEHFDWVLLIAALAPTALGLVTIYGISISQEQAGLFTFYKQLVAAGIGLVIVVGLAMIDYRHLRSFGLVSYLGGAALLLLVLFFGETVRGTQGWFRLGNLSFQPVEIAKITLVLYLATLFSRYAHGRLTWRVFGTSAGAVGLYAALILFQPDFGSAMVVLGVWAILCLFAGLPRWAWLIIPSVCLVLSLLLWNFGLKPYQRDRLTTFLNPQTDIRGSGYNAAQARIAIGSGGWFGKGIGEGSQARLRFLPEAATDFIFAVIGEELGFVGLALTLGLFLLIIYRYLRLAYDSEDDFTALMLVGLAGILLIHVVVNGGMNMGIMPITGIPMPLLSAAASSLVVTFITVGFAESVAMRRRSKSGREKASE